MPNISRGELATSLTHFSSAFPKQLH